MSDICGKCNNILYDGGVAKTECEPQLHITGGDVSEAGLMKPNPPFNSPRLLKVVNCARFSGTRVVSQAPVQASYMIHRILEPSPEAR
jgi:hypothetical protein